MLVIALLLALAVPLDVDHPPVCAADLKPFPTRVVVREARNAAWQHMLWCDRRLELLEHYRFEPWLPIREWHAEAKFTFRCWDALDDAQIQAGNMQLAGLGRDNLETNLRRLRDALGATDYYKGIMPIPVYWTPDDNVPMEEYP